MYSSVIRQKDESQNGCFKKTNHAKFFRKTKCSLFGKVVVRCFLETPVLRFTLLPYYRLIKQFPSFSEWIVKVVFPAPLPPTTSILNGCFSCTSICDDILLFNNNQSTYLLLLQDGVMLCSLLNSILDNQRFRAIREGKLRSLFH